MKISSLIKVLEKNNIALFDYVYIYSDLRYFLLNNKDAPLDFVNNFINYFLKNNITIIVPTFTYSKVFFEIDKTPSKLGFFSNFILKHKNSLRSHHPIFSYSALGKNKKIVKDIGLSAFGKDSIHARLLFNNACFLNIGRPLIKGNTLAHHVEKNYNANYRYEKIFKTKVYNKNKLLNNNFYYSAFVRKLNGKANQFSYKKVLKKILSEKIIKSYGNEEHFSNIDIYQYDLFYFKLHEYFCKDETVFLNT